MWDSYDVRKFCIDRALYTRGDSDSYLQMLKFVDDNPATEENVKLVAIDIISHSEVYSIFRQFDVEFMSNLLWKTVVA